VPDSGFWRDPTDPLGEKKREKGTEGFWRKPEHAQVETSDSLGRLLGSIVVIIGSLFVGDRIRRGKAGYWTWFVLGGLVALFFIVVRAC